MRTLRGNNGGRELFLAVCAVLNMGALRGWGTTVINGGTLSGGTYNDTVLQGDITVPYNGYISSSYGLVLDGATVHLQSQATGGLGPTFAAADLSGNGTIAFDVGDYSTYGVTGATISAGVTLTTGTGGGTLIFGTNNGNISVQSNSIIIGNNYNGTHWTNTGTIQLGGTGSLALLGVYTTSGLGTIVRTGGRLEMDGSLDNSNTTLDLDTVGSVVLGGDFGTIKGGIISSTSGNALVLDRYATLDGVTLNAPLVTDGNTYAVTIKNGLTVNHDLSLGVGTSFNFMDSTPLSGNSTITINGLANSSGYGDTFSNVTIGAGITLQTGVLPAGGSGAIGITGFTNYGTISAVTPTMPVLLGLDSRGFVSGTWTNKGTINVQGGLLYVGGAFSPSDLGTFVRTGGTVYCNGTITSAGSVLAFTDGTGPWIFTGGSISGGTVTATAGNEPIVSGTLLLTQVTLGAGMTVQPNGAALVSQGLTLSNGTVHLQGTSSNLSPGVLKSADASTMTITGTGSVLFDVAGGASQVSGPVVIGEGVAIRTGSGSGSVGTAGSSIENNGLISAETPNQYIRINGSIANAGTLSVSNGAYLFLPSTFTNSGTVSLNAGGRLIISDLAGPMGAVDRNGGRVGFSGTVAGTMNTLDLGGTTWGVVDLAGATLSNVTLVSSAGTPQVYNPLNPSNSTSTTATTLTNVTLATDLSMQPGAVLNACGTVTFSNSTIHMDGANATAPASLTIGYASSLAGTGNIIFDGGAAFNQVSGVSIIRSGISIQTGTGGGMIFGNYMSYGGSLSAKTAGQTITLSGNTVTVSSSGVFQAINGGSIVVGSPLASMLVDSGQIEIGAGSTIQVKGTFSQSATGNLTGTGVLSAARISGYPNIPLTINITGNAVNVVNTLSLAGQADHWTGKLNLGRADLIVRSTTGETTTLLNQLKQGFDGGAWDGSGGITATAPQTGGLATSLALMTGAEYQVATGNSQFDFQTYASTDLLLMHAIPGDANLDGQVDANDLNLVLSNFGKATSSWTAGNFVYDPTIDLSDLSAVLNHMGIGTAGPGGTTAGSGVPEPASLAVMTLGLVGLLKRRRF